MPKFSLMSDLELVGWMTNFIAVAKENPAECGVTIEQINDLEEKLEVLKEKISLRVAAEDKARAATSAQSASRNAVEPDCSYLTTIIKADAAIPDAVKLRLGIKPRKAPSYTSPVAPSELIAQSYSNGTTALKWHRAGNKPNTVFIIEYCEEREAGFKMLGATSEISYVHKNATVGKQCAYRVKAQRTGEESAYSNIAVAYMM